MVIRGTPKNINDYIVANSELAQELHQNGFMPKYIDGNGTYFIKSNEILKFIGKENKLG